MYNDVIEARFTSEQQDIILVLYNGDEDNIIDFIEDVGRHNAVDAIAGNMWLNDIESTNKIFY